MKMVDTKLKEKKRIEANGRWSEEKKRYEKHQRKQWDKI